MSKSNKTFNDRTRKSSEVPQSTLRTELLGKLNSPLIIILHCGRGRAFFNKLLRRIVNKKRLRILGKYITENFKYFGKGF